MVEIKGIEKFAPKDFPGVISSTVFVGGCNFRCPFCHNADLVLRPESLPSFPPEYFLGFLDSRKGWLEAVCISGGEPLIHENLEVLLRIVKDRNLLVKIDTNGAFPERLAGLIDKGLLDCVAMDIKTSLDKYRRVTVSDVKSASILESIEIILKSGLDYVFRTTAVPGLVDSDDLVEIGRLLEGSKMFQLQQFVPVNTLDKELEKTVPYSKVELQDMAESLRPFFENVRLEGV